MPANYHEHNFTVDDLNLAAAERQATIGKHYARTSRTEELLVELKQGTVTLPPHKPWTGDYTDWTADPFGDLNWRFQFQTLRWINPYLWDALDGNEESKQEWKRIVRSWAEANIPPSRAAEKYAWMDMTDGNRAIQGSLGAPLIDEDEQWYIDFLATHRNWLLDDEKIVPGNHGLHQNLGLFVVSSVLNDEVGVQRSIERLGAQILEAFDTEGLNEEGSVAYHQYNLDWWLQARERLQLEGYDFPAAAVRRLEKAGEAMAHLLLPDKTMPQVGDGGRGKGRRGLHPLLDQVLAGHINDPDLPLVRHFPNGFTVYRSGWGKQRPLKEESHTIIRHGKDLQRHSHNDRGSIHIYARGRRWLTDGGFHSYQRHNQDRNYTISRAAHNLITLPGTNYDKTGDVPIQHLQDRSDLHAIEILDENYDSAQWLRRIIFLPKLDCWVIWDRVRTEEAQKIRQQWLVDFGVVVSRQNDTCIRLNDEANHMTMRWFGDRPTIDITKGNRKTKSKRGLIGLRWKRMKDGTSIHAKFHTNQMESIVVISPLADDHLDVSLKKQSKMKSFKLSLRTTHGTYLVDARPKDTRLISKNSGTLH